MRRRRIADAGDVGRRDDADDDRGDDDDEQDDDNDDEQADADDDDDDRQNDVDDDADAVANAEIWQPLRQRVHRLAFFVRHLRFDLFGQRRRCGRGVRSWRVLHDWLSFC